MKSFFFLGEPRKKRLELRARAPLSILPGRDLPLNDLKDGKRASHAPTGPGHLAHTHRMLLANTVLLRSLRVAVEGRLGSVP